MLACCGMGRCAAMLQVQQQKQLIAVEGVTTQFCAVSLGSIVVLQVHASAVAHATTMSCLAMFVCIYTPHCPWQSTDAFRLCYRLSSLSWLADNSHIVLARPLEPERHLISIWSFATTAS